MNTRIYPQAVMDKAIRDYEDKLIQLYCEDCLEPWEKGVSNLNSLAESIPCPNCGSLVAPGVKQERMRELKIKKLIDE